MSQSGSANSNWKGGLVARECVHCGASFRVKPNRVRKGEGKFCSRVCWSAHYRRIRVTRARATRVVKLCVVCRAEIRVKPPHAKKEGTYCSRRCVGIGYAQRYCGSTNPNYRHGRAGTIEWARELNRNWWRRHPERRRVRNLQRKKARLSERDLRRMYHRQRGECAICFNPLGDKFHADHIIPLKRGGAGTIGNLQLTCPSCNMRKKTRLLADFRYRVLKQREAA